MTFVRQHPETFGPPDSQIFRDPKLGPVHADLVLYNPGKRLCTAIECKSFDVKQPSAAQLIKDVCWAARFFNQYWLLGSGETAELLELVRLADLGSLSNVGVAVLTDSLKVHRRPKVPERREKRADDAVFARIEEALLSGGL
jgi:hypothetical protein